MHLRFTNALFWVVCCICYMKRHLSRRSTYLSLRQSMQVLYVLQLHQDYEASTVHVSSVSEFLLTQPVLSFALLDAGRRRLVKAQEYDAEHAWSCTTGHSAWVQIAVSTLSGNSLRQTVHAYRASVHLAAKLVPAILRVVGVTAGLAESNGSLPPG